jgi:hypothetical protein
MGLYYPEIFDTTAEFNYLLSKHTKQYLSINSFLAAASVLTCLTAVSNTKTAMHLASSIKYKAAFSSTELKTARYRDLSCSLALTCFTGDFSSTSVPGCFQESSNPN